MANKTQSALHFSTSPRFYSPLEMNKNLRVPTATSGILRLRRAHADLCALLGLRVTQRSG